MQIEISGHHLEITEAIRRYIIDKFKRIERHSHQAAHAHVVLTIEKDRKKVEATVTMAGAKIFATTRHEDMYAAIDGLIDKLDRQITKRKEKLTDHHAKEARNDQAVS